MVVVSAMRLRGEGEAMKTLSNPPTWKAVKTVFPEESFVERFKIWIYGKVVLPDFDGDDLTPEGRRLKELSSPTEMKPDD
jgi:hypothetical protein